MASPATPWSLIALLIAPKSEFLVVGLDWHILEYSASADQFAEGAIAIGSDVRQCIPALAGIESCDPETRIELRGIQYKPARYVDIAIAQSELLQNRQIIWFSEATERMLLEQSLRQSVNESQLLLTQLRASKRYTDQIISSMADALVVTNQAGIIQTVNVATQVLLGYSEAELKGQPIAVLLQRLQETKPCQGREIEITCCTKTGKTIPIAFSCAQIQTELEEFRGRVYSLRDITQRKQAELARQAFFAAISHEIRTPMNAVLGITDWVLQTDLSTQQREWIEIIRNSSDSLLTILNDLLDFSKLESGKLELDESPFKLAKCIQSAIALLRHKASQKQLWLKLDGLDDLPPLVLGDATRLRQILVNLVGNAIKFTQTGGVTISMRSYPQKTSIVLQFAVQDTGIGIPANRFDRLFRSFGQVDPSIARQYGGTGLGLVISKQLCELMGGTIWVESEVGQGSTFYFTAVMQTAPADGACPGNPDFAERYPLQILVVEDDLLNQKIIQSMLGQLGYAADIVNDGQAAVEAVQRQSYDVVLMDVQMAGMGGIEATQAIVQLPQTTPRIVAMTAHTISELRSQCLAAGMADYLTKPIALEVLMQVLKRQASTPTPIPRRDNSPILDRQQLAQLQFSLGDSAESLVEMIDCFLSEVPKLLQHLQAAIADQDLDQFQRAIHTLTSSSATFGAIALHQHCLDLTARSLSLVELDHQLMQLATKYDATAAELTLEKQKYELLTQETSSF